MNLSATVNLTCNSVYISNIKQHLLVCQYEHLGLLVFMEKTLEYTDATTIRKDCLENELCCSVDNSEIVETADNESHLKLKEYLLILEMNACLNITQESMLLYLFDNDS